MGWIQPGSALQNLVTTFEINPKVSQAGVECGSVELESTGGQIGLVNWKQMTTTAETLTLTMLNTTMVMTMIMTLTLAMLSTTIMEVMLLCRETLEQGPVLDVAGGPRGEIAFELEQLGIRYPPPPPLPQLPTPSLIPVSPNSPNFACRPLLGPFAKSGGLRCTHHVHQIILGNHDEACELSRVAAISSSCCFCANLGMCAYFWVFQQVRSIVKA